MELWLDILMDALIDSIKLFPFLLLTYLLMSIWSIRPAQRRGRGFGKPAGWDLSQAVSQEFFHNVDFR